MAVLTSQIISEINPARNSETIWYLISISKHICNFRTYFTWYIFINLGTAATAVALIREIQIPPLLVTFPWILCYPRITWLCDTRWGYCCKLVPIFTPCQLKWWKMNLCNYFNIANHVFRQAGPLEQSMKAKMPYSGHRVACNWPKHVKYVKHLLDMPEMTKEWDFLTICFIAEQCARNIIPTFPPTFPPTPRWWCLFNARVPQWRLWAPFGDPLQCCMCFYCILIKKSGYTVEYWIFRTAQKGYLHQGLKGIIKEQWETMTCHQLCLSFIPDENIFGVHADPAYALV